MGVTFLALTKTEFARLDVATILKWCTKNSISNDKNLFILSAGTNLTFFNEVVGKKHLPTQHKSLMPVYSIDRLYYTQRGNKFNFSNEVGGQQKDVAHPT